VQVGRGVFADPLPSNVSSKSDTILMKLECLQRYKMLLPDFFNEDVETINVDKIRNCEPVE
jgi:hypothetical protein